MKVEVFIINDKDQVKRAMLATKGLKPTTDKPINDEVWFGMLRAKHSPIEEYRVWVYAEVPERVHTHIVRHEEIGKYVTTSRPDIKGNQELKDGYRKIALVINAKRLIEIANQRLCYGAVWGDTLKFVQAIVNSLEDETLKRFLVPPCVVYGCCIDKAKCGYDRSVRYAKQREKFVNYNS